MKCMLQSGPALAIALAMSSGALANPEDPFSDVIELTDEQLDTFRGGLAFGLGLLSVSIPIAINLGDAQGTGNIGGPIPITVQIPINFGDALGAPIDPNQNQSSSANPILINLGSSPGTGNISGLIPINVQIPINLGDAIGQD